MRTPDEWASFARQYSQTIPLVIEGMELWLKVWNARSRAAHLGITVTDEDLEDVLIGAVACTVVSGRTDWHPAWYDLLDVLLRLREG